MNLTIRISIIIIAIWTGISKNEIPNIFPVGVIFLICGTLCLVSFVWIIAGPSMPNDQINWKTLFTGNVWEIDHYPAQVISSWALGALPMGLAQVAASKGQLQNNLFFFMGITFLLTAFAGAWVKKRWRKE